jgi:tRNA dimethylallyltransferase
MDFTLYCLSGPTAVGKTELALRWAEQFDAEILYCDAVSFYQGMDVGSAKPNKEEQSRVPHHGIDLVPVSLPYTIADYLEYAQKTIREIHSRGKRVLITGGSGFYLKSFFAPVVDSVFVSDEIRFQVRQLEAEDGLLGLQRALNACNPDGVEGVDMLNPRRVSRALERCLASGKTVEQLQAEFASQGTPFDEYPRQLCVLMRDRDELRSRVAIRTQQMLDAGLIDEVKCLLNSGIEENSSAASAIGYREVIEWLDVGSTDLDALAALISQNTNRLIKKQCTWFRNQLKVDHLYEMKFDQSGDERQLFQIL